MNLAVSLILCKRPKKLNSRRAPCLTSTALNNNKTRGTLQQVPTRQIRLSFVECAIQIFAICNIILDVYNGFHYRKNMAPNFNSIKLTLILLKNDNMA